MAKTTVHNISTGARGIRDVNGTLVMIERGQSAEVDISAEEKSDGKATGWFKFGGAAASADDGEEEGKPLSRMNKTELLETAEAEGVEIEEGATNAQIVEAIEKKRAA
jgi:predicted Zn-dependent protease